MTARRARFRLWPQTLLGQTLAATVIVILLSQILTLLLFSQLVLKPELHRVSKIMAQSVAAMSDSLSVASPEIRARMIERLNRSAYIQIWSGATPPDSEGPPPRALERVFMQQLVDELGHEAGDADDIYWRTDKNRKLWIRIHMGNEAYWISVKPIAVLGPTGAAMLAILLSGVLAFLLAWRVNTKVMRPLSELKSATETYSPSSNSPLLNESGPREIAFLSHSFNLMTQRLARTEADRTLILAGISHDLRTPLAKLRLALDMMSHNDNDLRDSAHHQVETIDRILSQFMMFARGFAAEPVATLDLHAFLEAMRRDYAAYGVAIDNHLGVPTLVCRPEALRRAVTNLIENAIRYGKAPIVLELQSDAVKGCRIVVRDHGPGVAPEKLPSLTEPFVRGHTARTPDAAGELPGSLPSGGTGLGLAIVQKIALLHNGQLTLRNLDDGFEAQLTIPQAA